MQLSIRWLGEWVDGDIRQTDLGNDLTMAGLEVASIRKQELLHKKIVVGEIVNCCPHPLRKRLKVCKVSVGRKRMVEIVCGAKNARVGVKAPTALTGAVLPDGQAVSRRSFHEVFSSGMLCSSSEIGIDDGSDGLLELDRTARVGSSITEHLELDDAVIDIDLTPNRGDCLSILGIAREIAAIRGIAVKEQTISKRRSTVSSAIPIAVEAYADAPRYVGRVVEKLEPHSVTPDWMKERLRRCGLRSINPVVDITNYVMLEFGQPLHAFDMDAVAKGIVVRHSRAGETLKLLDGTELELSPGTVIIANQNDPIGLAGIMGGQSSGVTRHTQSIFVEAAYFSPDVIRNRAREYGLQTDASYRFERGVDPTQQRRALSRASDLLIEHCGGRLGPISEVSRAAYIPKKTRIVVNKKRLNEVLGTKIKGTFIQKTLTSLNMAPEKYVNGWKIQPPQYRFDIEGEHDVIEEIARLFGFSNIPNEPPRIVARSGLTSEKEMQLDSFENYLVNRDYSEVITYSFVDEQVQSRLDPKGSSVKVRNPIASNMNVMRLSLWPGLLESVGVNYRRQTRRIRLFETGHVFSLESGKVVEKIMVGAAVCGPWDRPHWQDKTSNVDFFDIKGTVEGLLALDGQNRKYRYLPKKHPALHPGQSAEIRFGSQSIGVLGLLHPSIQKFFELETPVYLFELDLAAIAERNIPSYRSISRFPSVTRDISILVKGDIAAMDFEETILRAGGDLLTSICLFDVYSGKGIKKFYKSLSFSLTLQSSSRNLTDKEIEAVLEQIVTALEAKGGQLRPGFNNTS